MASANAGAIVLKVKRRPEGREEWKNLTIQMKRDSHERLKKLAERSGYSMRDLLTRAIDEFVGRVQIEE